MKKILCSLIVVLVMAVNAVAVCAAKVVRIEGPKAINFFIQIDGEQMDTASNVTGRDVKYFTEVLANSTLKKEMRTNESIVIGPNGNQNVTEQDIKDAIVSVPSMESVFEGVVEQFKGRGYIKSNTGDVIPWAALNTKNYRTEWYVLKWQSKCWHIDGRIIDLKTDKYVNVVVPDDPADIPERAYAEDTEYPQAEEKDTAIDLKGVDYAYIFGYAPIIKKNGDGSETVILRMAMEDKVTVEQVCAMMVRLLDRAGVTAGKTLEAVPEFAAYKDVWSARGISYMVSKGALDKGAKALNVPVTRGQVAKLVSCALDLTKSAETDFTDIAGNTYKEYIEKVYAYGYMNGLGGNKFAPNVYLSRAEFCQLINNIIGRDESYKLIANDANGEEITPATYGFTDMTNKNHWAYETCLKATSCFNEDKYVDLEARKDNIRNKLDDYKGQNKY